MMILARWLISALMFLVVANLVPGIHVKSFLTALLLAVLWSVVTMVLKPILLILTLPVNMLTFGLFTLVINGFLFWFLARLVPGFEIAGFGVAILGALALSILHMIVHFAFREKND
ncbi:MAG: putative rane protein [Patescibacteria group bacterium]|nr:putative rane protein [Patescibacteria group bacterium]